MHVKGPYTADNLTMPERDLDERIDGAPETRFVNGASMQEGVAGRMKIDTEYENTSDSYLDLVRSDVTRYDDHPAPRDTARYKYPHRS